MKLSILLLSIFLGTLASLAYFPDPLLLLIIIFGGAIWIGLPCLIGGLIALMVANFRNRSTRPSLLFLLSVVAFFAICGLAVPLNSFIFHRAELEAKAYPDRIKPLLENYRSIHGVYPETLDLLPNKPSLPRLLRKSWCYRSDGYTYSFCFPQPGGMIDVWDYHSETQKWHLST